MEVLRPAEKGRLSVNMRHYSKPIAEIERHLANPTELNALFRFDLVKQEIAAGHSEAEMRRIHNMAYVFMRDDHLPLGRGFTDQLQIVIHCPEAECEAAYLDVMNLWSKGND
jgi:hypothetical protein